VPVLWEWHLHITHFGVYNTDLYFFLVFSLTNLFTRFKLDRSFPVKMSKYLHLVIMTCSIKNVVSFPVCFLCNGKAFFLCGVTAKRESRPPYSWGSYITHNWTHTHPVALIWTSDRLVAEAATYKTHNKHKWRTSMPSAGFEPAIRTIRPTQTCFLDRTATAIV
jgi:hypothetical protein